MLVGDFNGNLVMSKDVPEIKQRGKTCADFSGVYGTHFTRCSCRTCSRFRYHESEVSLSSLSFKASCHVFLKILASMWMPRVKRYQILEGQDTERGNAR
jgi:hypothetical protein